MQVSEQKGKVDAAKGECLDEISAVVEEINSKIRSRKGVLAPKITELRAARAKHAEVTAAHGQARTAYLKAQDSHEARLAGLEEQVSELQAAVDEVCSCLAPSSLVDSPASRALVRFSTFAAYDTSDESSCSFSSASRLKVPMLHGAPCCCSSSALSHMISAPRNITARVACDATLLVFKLADDPAPWRLASRDTPLCTSAMVLTVGTEFHCRLLPACKRFSLHVSYPANPCIVSLWLPGAVDHHQRPLHS